MQTFVKDSWNIMKVHVVLVIVSVGWDWTSPPQTVSQLGLVVRHIVHSTPNIKLLEGLDGKRVQYPMQCNRRTMLLHNLLAHPISGREPPSLKEHIEQVCPAS